MSHTVTRLLLALVLVGAVASAAWAQSATAPPAPAQPAEPVNQEVVHEVAAQLRCVVCQNLSVADSPSEMASQMRAIIRERLAAGESPAEVQRYFVDRYGEWILLSPPRRGFNLLVWLLPFVAVVVGLVAAGALVWRWTHRPGRARPAPVAVDAAMSERIRRELERES
jgi:cytochrome c-type biogenesis protein CcmH